jgi:hypothetical protein
MRIYPPVSVEEAFEWLKGQAEAESGDSLSPRQEEALKSLAEAMALVSSIVLPEEIEPFLL